MKIIKKQRVEVIVNKDFNTSDASGRIAGRVGDVLTLAPATAKRLIEAGLVEMKRKPRKTQEE